MKVLAEGSVAEGVPEGGYFVTPTLFGASGHSSELLAQEIFGPVLVALPFGGVKKSGHGREKGLIALEEMSITKTIVQFLGE